MNALDTLPQNNLIEIQNLYAKALGIILSKNYNTDIFKNIITNINLIINKKLIERPDILLKINMDFFLKSCELNNNFFSSCVKNENTKLKDKRFKSDAWHSNPYFNYIGNFYNMWSDWMMNSVESFELQENENIVKFFLKQIESAMCPTNSVLLNPDVLSKTIATNYDNLKIGFQNFVKDLEASKEVFQISTCNKEAYEVGKNIATSEGKVIFKNKLIELILYKPLKETHEIPLFVIPPWINKYYILDLTEQNSLVKHLVNNNMQVFLLSFVNPNETHKNIDFEDYIKLGILEPIEYLQKQFNYKSFNFLGYCLGGTLLGSLASFLDKKLINSITFFTTLLDFKNPGELGIFSNDIFFNTINDHLSKAPVFSGNIMSLTFSYLRANDMIWSNFVNNYLLGNEPINFDILYWNQDSTNLPARMQKFYLTNMYKYNLLCKKNALTLLGNKIDLSNIKANVFSLSCMQDHIVPWQEAFDSLKHLSSNITFCLSTSGHVAGVINPPSKKKYSYFVNNNFSSKESPKEWLSNAVENQGSWWDYWISWLVAQSSCKTKSLNYDNVKYLYQAPGEYVKIMSA